MLHRLCYITFMARGNSGRIVIEVEPETKRQLYAALDLAGSTLKEWFIKHATDFSTEAIQPSLFNITTLPSGKARDLRMGTPNTDTAKSIKRKNGHSGKPAR